MQYQNLPFFEQLFSLGARKCLPLLLAAACWLQQGTLRDSWLCTTPGLFGTVLVHRLQNVCKEVES